MTRKKKHLPDTELSIERFLREYRTPLEAMAKARTEPRKADFLLAFNDQLDKGIEKYLAQLGITRIANVAYGSTAVVCDTIQGQMVKIVDTQKEKKQNLPDLPQLLRPILSKTICNGRVRIEILPKVRVWPQVEITQAHIHSLIKSLANTPPGYLFYDCKSDNVGLLSDGTPVIIDAGSVVSIAETEKHEVIRYPDFGELKGHTYLGQFYLFLEYLQFRFPQRQLDLLYDRNEPLILESFKQEVLEKLEKIKNAPDKKVPSYDWETAQRQHCEDLKIELGKLTGFISPEDMKRFREERNLPPKGDGQDTTHGRLAAASGNMTAVYGKVVKAAAASFPMDRAPANFRTLGQRMSGEQPGNMVKLERLLSLFDWRSPSDLGLCHRIDRERKRLLQPERGT